MDAPKCRLCGEKHYGACKTWAGRQRQEPCAGCVSKEAVIAALRAELDKRKANDVNNAANGKQKTVNRKQAGANGEVNSKQRSAYMREYMKAYRARRRG